MFTRKNGFQVALHRLYFNSIGGYERVEAGAKRWCSARIVLEKEGYAASLIVERGSVFRYWKRYVNMLETKVKDGIIK